MRSSPGLVIKVSVDDYEQDRDVGMLALKAKAKPRKDKSPRNMESESAYAELGARPPYMAAVDEESEAFEEVAYVSDYMSISRAPP